MYNVRWKDNIPILTSEKTKNGNPRPVYYEELDLLGFSEHWKYPECEEPLLWAVNRKYYYNGRHVATVKGGDCYNLPELRIKQENIILKPVLLDKLKEYNDSSLRKLKYHAGNTIECALHKYEDATISTGYSGGKDSQVLLDIVYDYFKDHVTVIFSDTTLEHEYTYENLDKTEEYYDIQLKKVKPKKSADDLFESHGLMSRFQRWCTPILKTAPYHNLMDELKSDDKLIVFEGVRREESKKREEYEPIADSVVYKDVVNVRPLLDWTSTEIYLYILCHGLPLNKLYRYGLTRVGCEFCPFQSKWSELIYSHLNSTFHEKYAPLIQEYARFRGLEEKEEIEDFICEGQWKKRAGGKGINYTSLADFIIRKKYIKAIINGGSNLSWLDMLDDCNVKYHSVNGRVVVECDDVNVQERSVVRKVVKKATYCVDCGYCEAVCKNNAFNGLYDEGKCVGCGDCLGFNYHACYRASSIFET